MTLVRRIRELGLQAKKTAEHKPATWIFICYIDEVGPTQRDSRRFEEAYLAKFGQPASIVLVNCDRGRMSGSAYGDRESVDVQYEYTPQPLESKSRPFKELS